MLLSVYVDDDCTEVLLRKRCIVTIRFPSRYCHFSTAVAQREAYRYKAGAAVVDDSILLYRAIPYRRVL